MSKAPASSAAARLVTLDKTQTRIMIADANRNIIYTNQSVVDFLQEAEAEIRQDLPAFNVKTLIGTNIDSFHKAPEHQKKMLAEMKEPYKTTIKVGGRIFDLLATPLFDEHKKRVGTSVEWADAALRLENMVFSAVSDAISRAQAVIEFDMNGTLITANPNFCQTVGYSLDEIKGKPHKLFWDPAEGASQAYTQFWDKMRRGEFESGEYRRFGKGGKEIWLQASYNPVLDEKGKPFKVVKFATDITQQKLKNAEYEGQINAIGKSQAVIHFQPDGTILWANDNFCNAMGYVLSELVGKHHSLFVDASYRNSPEYREFWENLRAGQFKADEFRRVGKGGKEVFIQASYNPIVDASGKVFKIVKFASDVTEIVQRRRENEKRSVQMAQSVTDLLQNMGTITSEMDQTAGEMLGKAQHSETLSSSVASAAVELSASIKEISERLADASRMANTVNSQTEQASAAVRELNESIARINGITEVIGKVASQTGLLALNAQIESARAGEAGKGFAVVAQEVKTLSRQTASSADDIRQQIQSVTAVARQTTDAIAAIIDSVRRITEATTQIAAAVEEQSVVTNEVSANINGVTDSSRSTGESAIQVQKVAASLNRSSTSLGKEVSQFITDSRAA